MKAFNKLNPELDMPFFYQPDIAGSDGTLTPDESKHIAKVLRFKVGDHIQITNGKGNVCRCTLTAISLHKCTVEVLNTTTLPRKKYSIHVAVAPTKNMSRIEWFVEKSIEIGVDQFSFICCENSERKSINLERLKKKAIGALKQSRQAWLPIFNPIVPFTDISVTHNVGFIAHTGNPSSPHLKYVAKPHSNSIVLIGPEGGFTIKELNIAKKNGFKSVSLGLNKLRTETAGLVACHVLNLINQ